MKGGAGGRDVLVIFSDMWQETGELNFGRVSDLCDSDTVDKVKSHGLTANLRDADIYALGTNSPGHIKSEWRCAHELWAKYFIEAQAKLRDYWLLRSMQPK